MTYFSFFPKIFCNFLIITPPSHPTSPCMIHTSQPSPSHPAHTNLLLWAQQENALHSTYSRHILIGVGGRGPLLPSPQHRVPRSIKLHDLRVRSAGHNQSAGEARCDVGGRGGGKGGGALRLHVEGGGGGERVVY